MGADRTVRRLASWLAGMAAFVAVLPRSIIGKYVLVFLAVAPGRYR
jgi:hypothetical protein